MPINDRAAWKTRTLNRRRARYGNDLCDLIAPEVTDQYSGHTISDNTIATNVPCWVERVRGGGADIVAGGVVVTTSHRITMPATDATRLIDEHYKIKVLARDDNPEMIFEQPVRSRGSSEVMVSVQAIIHDGYSPPGIT